MPVLVVWGMIAAGVAMLAAGLLLSRARFASALGAGRILAFGPAFEAAALAIFAAEHFLATRAVMSVVPRWMPQPLFWTWFVGAALLAAALSLISGRYVRWSATLLALLFLIFVAAIHLPNLAKHLDERLFWTLTFRETAFAGAAMVLAGSVWPRGSVTGSAFLLLGRVCVAVTLVFYAIEHFLFPRFAPGVPLTKTTPPWVPAPVLFAYVVGAVLLAAGIGLLIPSTVRLAAATGGILLLLLTVFLYVPILAAEIHSPLALEGINYVGDTLLFAATILLAGLLPDTAESGVTTRASSA